MKATALEHYPIYFSEPGCEAGTTSQTDSRLALRPPSWSWASQTLEPVCPLRPGKALAGGLSAGQLASLTWVLGSVMLDNKENLSFSTHVM